MLKKNTLTSPNSVRPLAMGASFDESALWTSKQMT